MHRYLPLVLIVALLIAFRAIGSHFAETVPNFQPLAALFFCGALLAPGWRGFAIPLGIWAITFPMGVGHTSSPALFVTTLVAIIAVFFLGKSLSTRNIPTLLVGSALGAVVFHLITCGAAWLGDPLYAKTLTGLYQSVWAGPETSGIPSWIFLRNLAAANLLFTGLFLVSRLSLPIFIKNLAPTPALAKVR
jgi:hypothetical protein